MPTVLIFNVEYMMDERRNNEESKCKCCICRTKK